MAVPRKRIGPYRLLEPVGSGGMGIVWRAVHEVLQRQVAIKELTPAGAKDKESIERFRREGMALAQLKHESVVGIHDLFIARERLYMVLEYVDGPTLRGVLKSGPLPWDLVAIVGHRLAAALEHAHHHKLIHRDIKPANVMLAKSGEVKLMDFGIARDQALNTLTETGMAVGTPEYMAPEVITGGKADAQSDLYSLGVMLYECLCGERPFDGVAPEKVFRAILSGKFRPLGKRLEGVPKQLVSIVERCMKVNPKKRYATAAELRLAFEELLLASHARANHRERVLGYLRALDMISETEAQTCIDLASLRVTASSELKPPTWSGWPALAAVASIWAFGVVTWLALERPDLILAALK